MTQPAKVPAERVPVVLESPDRVHSRGRLSLILGLVICAAIAVYALWYTSAGAFPTFPAIQNDYIDLGEAFLHGQLSLLEKPDPRLASLPNPYEYKQRRQIPYHWDASYYGGKYYLYWGPVPAVISAGLELILRAPPSASVLVVLPYALLLLVFLGILRLLSRLFPGTAAKDSLWLFVMPAFFNLPLLFLIGQPRHYQASIMYGQLFLLAGLLGFALYGDRRRPGWLLFSSLCFGLAIASRYNLAISVGIYLAFASWWLLRKQDGARNWLAVLHLAAPLALCMLGLGLYNFVRFGNLLETGLGYQLTIPEFQKITYSAAYIPSNLYVYLVYPLTGAGTFPFIQAAHFRPAMLPDWLTVPPNREVDQVILGIFSSAPIVWLMILGIPFIALLLKDVRSHPPEGADHLDRHFLFAMIAAAAAGQFLFLMVFFYAAERYIADFYLPLILCLALIVWRVDESLRSARALRAFVWIAVCILAVWTAAIGYFGCFGVPTLVSNFYDPRMLGNLASFWNRMHAIVQAIGGVLLRVPGS